MQGLRRSYSYEDITQPETTPIRKTKSETDLASAMQGASNATDPRVTAPLDVSAPGPLIPDFKGFNTGATADPGEGASGSRDTLPELTIEQRQANTKYYFNLLSPAEWQTFHEKREALMSKQQLTDNEDMMLKSINWYLAAIEHGSIRHACNALGLPSVKVHMAIAHYVFCVLLNRQGEWSLASR